jgi:hypothetical protein
MKRNNIQKTQAKSNTQGGQPKRRNNRTRKRDQAKPVIVAPTAMSRSSVTRKPNIKSLPNGDCRIRHREYIQDISANTGTPSTFKVESLDLNPGRPATFPWLSQVAQRFEKYKFEKLHFDYETEAPSTLGGTLVLAVDYDASDRAPLSKQQAMAYQNSARSSPWNMCKHISSKENLSQQKAYFVRSRALGANCDIKLYDVGKLHVISQGITTASAELGELYVEYDIVLQTPALNGIVISGGMATSGGTKTNANPFGDDAIVAEYAAGFTFINSEVTFLEYGDYMVTVSGGGAGISDFTSSEGTSLDVLDDGFVVNGSGSLYVYFARVRIVSLSQATLSFSGTGTTWGTADLMIGQAPDTSL